MRKPSAEEILKAVEQAPLDDAAERVLAMTPAQRRRELEGAGVDLAELHSKADALHARMMRAGQNGEQHKAASENSAEDGGAWEKETAAPVPSRLRARWIALLAAALGAATVGGTVYGIGRIAHREDDKNQVVPDGGIEPTPQQVLPRAIDAGPVPDSKQRPRVSPRDIKDPGPIE